MPCPLLQHASDSQPADPELAPLAQARWMSLSWIRHSGLGSLVEAFVYGEVYGNSLGMYKIRIWQSH